MRTFEKVLASVAVGIGAYLVLQHPVSVAKAVMLLRDPVKKEEKR